MSTGRWFPRLSQDGRWIASGHTTITVEAWDGSLTRDYGQGVSPRWLAADVLIAKGHSDLSTYWIDAVNGRREVIATIGANEIAAADGRWAVARGIDDMLSTSWGLRLPKGLRPALAGEHFAHLSVPKDPGQPVIVLDGAIVADGWTDQIEVTRSGDLAWRDPQGVIWGRSQSGSRVALSVDTARQEFGFCLIETPSGVWVLSHDHDRLMLRPWGERHGYVVRVGITHHPHAVYADGVARIVWTDDAGGLTRAAVNPAAPRVDLRDPTPDPGPVPDPDPAPDLLPFFVGVCWPNPYPDTGPIEPPHLATLADVGFTHVRTDCDWRADRDVIAHNLVAIQAAGMTPIPILGFDYRQPAPPEFAAFCQWMASWELPWYEVGNEPIVLHTMRASHYITYAQAARANIPTGRIILAPDLYDANSGRWRDQGFAEQVIAESRTSARIFLALHPYRNPRSPQWSPWGSREAEHAWCMAQAGHNRFVTTEVGWKPSEGDVQASGHYHLREIEIARTLGLAGVCLYTHVEDRRDPRFDFGLFTHAWEPRLSARSLRVALRPDAPEPKPVPDPHADLMGDLGWLNGIYRDELQRPPRADAYVDDSGLASMVLARQAGASRDDIHAGIRESWEWQARPGGDLERMWIATIRAVFAEQGRTSPTDDQMAFAISQCRHAEWTVEDIRAWVAALPRSTRLGRLRISPDGGCFVDDTGPILPVGCHFGDGLAKYGQDRAFVQRLLDAIAAARYDMVRTWTVLHGEFWRGREVGPQLGTMAYWDLVREWCHELQTRGLRWVVSQGDLLRAFPGRADRHAFMAQLADTIAGVDPTLAAFVDAGNEAIWNGEDDPATLREIVRVFTARLPSIASLTSPYGEEPHALRSYAHDVYDVHGHRDGQWVDKVRHVFNVGYEGAPRIPMRLGIQSEPFGPGDLVSASRNKHELTGEVMSLAVANSLISRQAWVYFSGAGVKCDSEDLVTMPGFAETPAVRDVLPRDVMAWPVLCHGGTSQAARVFAVPGTDNTRADHAIAADGRFVCVLYGDRWRECRMVRPATITRERTCGSYGRIVVGRIAA